MQNIRLEQNGFVKISSRTLKPAIFIKVQPQSVDFLEISNPRAVLENSFRKYAVLTRGDIILFRYNSKDFYLEVLRSFFLALLLISLLFLFLILVLIILISIVPLRLAKKDVYFHFLVFFLGIMLMLLSAFVVSVFFLVPVAWGLFLRAVLCLPNTPLPGLPFLCS